MKNSFSKGKNKKIPWVMLAIFFVAVLLAAIGVWKDGIIAVISLLLIAILSLLIIARLRLLLMRKMIK